MKRVITMLGKKQMKVEQKLRAKSKVKSFSKGDTILLFYGDDLVDGESFQDPKGMGWNKTTISLNGPQKYISLFTCDIGLRVYLTNKEARELKRSGMLHLVERYEPDPDPSAAEVSEEKSKKPVLLN